jgi:hypothetical protein
MKMKTILLPSLLACLLVSQISVQAQQCIPPASATSTYYISGFTTTGGAVNINNPNNIRGTNGYSDYYASYSASYAAGATVNFTLSCYTTGSYTYGMGVWIDWNNDGDFSDAGELMVGTTLYTAVPWSNSFVIPSGQAAGSYRMRVFARYLGGGNVTAIDPCTLAPSNGEYEDYKLVVASPCPTPSSVSVSPTSVCLGNSITLNASIPTGGATTTNWYTVSSGGTAVASTTSASTTYTPTAAGTYTFYAEAVGSCVTSTRVATATVTVTFCSTPCPTPTNVSATPTSVCLGSPVTLNATMGASTTNWYTAATGGTTVATTTSGSTTYTPTAAGTYTFYAEAAGSVGGSGTPQNFSYTGAVQSVTLQPGTYQLECWGADGGNNTGANTGGKGGYSLGNLNVTVASTYYIYVGGKGQTATTSGVSASGGFNGGGNSGAYTSTLGRGSGGGASHIATATGLLNTLSANTASVVIVAGGGGGSGGNHGTNNTQDKGGNGGGTVGANGLTGTYGGYGGTQTAGGNNSAIVPYSGAIAQNGSFGQGGSANQFLVGSYPNNTGGGGGGGWYGGAAALWEGGGGGSGYIGGVTSGVTAQTSQTGFVVNPDASGNGYVRITPQTSACAASTRVATATVTVTPPPSISIAPASASVCAGSSVSLTASGATSYSWSPAIGLSATTGATVIATPTVNTIYTVTGTIAGCSATQTVAITIEALPDATVTANGTTAICPNSSVTLSTATGTGLTYQWLRNGNPITTGGTT